MGTREGPIDDRRDRSHAANRRVRRAHDPRRVDPAAVAERTSAQVTAMWSKFGPVGQLIVGASIALIVIALVGAIVNAWEDSARSSAWW